MNANPFREQDFREHYGPAALIAGGAQGIGAAYADYVAGRGLDVFIVDRDEAQLRQTCRELEQRHGVSCQAIVADLSDPDSLSVIEPAVGAVEVGLLVYNAALADVGPFYKANTGLDDELSKIRVNVESPLRLVYRFARPMLQRNRGGIILMASGAGQQGSPYYAHYAATKAYNIVLAESLWYEFKPYRVDVLACVAGMTSSPAVQAARERGEGQKSIYQTPEEVVAEAMEALGRVPSHVTGVHNRDNQGLLHSLPREQAVAAIARHAIDNFLGGETPPQHLDNDKH